MAVTVRKSSVFKPTKQPYTKVGTWRAAKRVFLKKAGVWIEVWPEGPNPPTNVHVTTPIVADNVTISGTWSAPAAGGEPADKYQVRIVFRNITTGAESATAWIDRTLAQLSYTNDNSGNGWQHRKGQKVRIEVVAVCSATALIYERRSVTATSEEDTTPGLPVVTVPTLPAPPVPINFDINIVACDLTQTWNHVGGNSLDYFEIETWLGGFTPTKYKVASTLRTWTTQPWNATTIGRAYVYSRIRAVGEGGASAWVTLSGTMPGPLLFSDLRFEGGVLKLNVGHNYDGMAVYRQKYGGGAVFQGNVAANSGGGWQPITDTTSSGYARDNVSNYRLGFIPRNSANAWTGRTQWTDWAIKIPNPVFIRPYDCNTWWSIPIPGKWRTNPQADNWFYQGKSISGNSYGTLFYQQLCPSYFSVARIGYQPSVTAWDIHVKRTNTGGLVAAVALNTWQHATLDDSNNQHDAHPTLINGPLVGPSLARNQQVWLRLPTSWWPGMASGSAKGICFYVPPGQADNQLRSEIGNVSNRYMILDKPTYGTYLDGQPPGTLRIYHDG